MHPDYLMFLTIKVILLLLSPHIAHIILVVLETHLWVQLQNDKKRSLMLHSQVVHIDFSKAIKVNYDKSPCTILSSPRSCENSWVTV